MYLDIKNWLEKYLTEKYVSIILFISSFIILFSSLIVSYFESYLRYDEIFTLTLIKDTLPNIIKLTAMDVHPPLHYFIVKAFVYFGQEILHLPFDSIYLGEISSAIPFLLLMVFSYFYLRRDIGWLSAGLFSFSLISMPQMIFYSGDIRMYPWGMLFTTLSFYMAYKITITDTSNKNSYKYYLLLIFFTVCGAYTQYYCSVAILGVYFVLFTYLTLNNDIKKIKRLILSGIISVVSFLPWIPTLIQQTHYVSNSFWIGEFNAETLFNSIIYFLSATKIGETTWTLLGSPEGLDLPFLSSLLIVLILVSIHYLFKGKYSVEIVRNRLLKVNFLTYGALIILFEVFTGMLASNIIGKPILHVRYLVIGIALFWLSVSMIIGKTYHLKNKSIFLSLFILFVVGGLISSYYGFHILGENNKLTQLMKDDYKLIGSNDLIIDTDLTVTGWRELFKHHSDDNTLISSLDSYWEPPYYRVYSSRHDMSVFKRDKFERINNTLNHGDKVWISGGIDGDGLQRLFQELMVLKDYRYGYLDPYYVKKHHVLIEIGKK